MSRILIKSKEEIEKVRVACRVTSKILDEVGEIIKPGISSDDINTFVHRRTLELGGIPSPLNYRGFPKSVCTSVNDVICHGIPSEDVVLRKGDILNVDVTTFLDGYHGDSSRMYFVGGREACSRAAVELVDQTKLALMAGLESVIPGKRIGDIGAAIQRYIESTKKGYGIVREYTGHGIGKDFHEEPHVLHYGRGSDGPIIKPGMIFTVEPMINMGGRESVLDGDDGWTVRTKDGSLSAQWEHTVLVTEDSWEALTDSEKF